MARYDRLVELRDPQFDAPQQKPKRKIPFDKIEQILVAASIFLLATALKYVFAGEGAKPEAWGTVMEIVDVETVSEVQPPEYDPNRELRIPIAEHRPNRRLKPRVIILRGPWKFGVSGPENVTLVLGAPVTRGAGHLVYDFPDGKARLSILFNAGRLDTIALAPNRCPPEPAPCPQPYEWTLTQRQIHDEGLQFEAWVAEPDVCGTLGAPTRAVYYATCSPQEKLPPAIRAIYVQRLTREILNPPFPRNLAPSATPPAALAKQDYARLLEHYQDALLLKEKAIGVEHASVLFLRFELGRLQEESGPAEAGGRNLMTEAVESLERNLGRDHPDVVAARKALPPARS